jgi:ubiquitin-like-conjugating enzyme ATG3
MNYFFSRASDTLTYLKNKTNEIVQDVTQRIVDPPKEELFLKTGQLSPEEFVRAGDHLVSVASKEGWKWMPAKPEYSKKYLPPDKQYLLIEDVPCEQRALNAYKNQEEGYN